MTISDLETTLDRVLAECTNLALDNPADRLALRGMLLGALRGSWKNVEAAEKRAKVAEFQASLAHNARKAADRTVQSGGDLLLAARALIERLTQDLNTERESSARLKQVLNALIGDEASVPLKGSKSQAVMALVEAARTAESAIMLRALDGTGTVCPACGAFTRHGATKYNHADACKVKPLSAALGLFENQEPD